jgi:hypothetical protein
MTRSRNFTAVTAILVVFVLCLAGGVALAQKSTSSIDSPGILMPDQHQVAVLASTEPVTPTQSIEASPTRAQSYAGAGSGSNSCEVTLLEPEVIQDEAGNPQIRLHWALDRSLGAGEYYLLFLGGLVDEAPYIMGSFWDPVAEDKGPWSLELLETMAPWLKLFELKEPAYDIPLMETDDGILRWEIQVRTTGSDFREASTMDLLLCKRDSALLSVTSTDGISPTLSLEVIPTPTLMPTPTISAEDLLLAITPEPN